MIVDDKPRSLFDSSVSACSVRILDGSFFLAKYILSTRCLPYLLPLTPAASQPHSSRSVVGSTPLSPNGSCIPSRLLGCGQNPQSALIQYLRGSR